MAFCGQQGGDLGGAKALPLAGKNILVTRAREQAGEIVARLEQLGAQVIVHPTLVFDDPEDFTGLDRAIRSLREFDWMLLTSQNAVSYFMRRCQALGGAIPETLKIATVGPKTAEAAERAGLSVEYVAKESRGEAFARELSPRLAGKKVLYPVSDQAGGGLSNWLRSQGVEVADVVAYRTRGPESSPAGFGITAFAGRLDVITFFSPSAFRNFAEGEGLRFLQYAVNRVALAAIGPTTAAAIRAAGLPVAIEAPQATAADLTNAICCFFAPLPEPERNRQ